MYNKQKACLLVFDTKPNMYDILSEHGAIWTFLFVYKQTNKRIHVGLDSTVYSKQKACLLVFGTKPNMYDILSEHGAIWT